MALVHAVRAAVNTALGVLVGAFTLVDWLVFTAAVGTVAAFLVYVVNVFLGFLPSFSQIVPVLDSDRSGIFEFCSYVFNFDFLKTYVLSYFFTLVGFAAASISISIGFVITVILPILADHVSHWLRRVTGD